MDTFVDQVNVDEETPLLSFAEIRTLHYDNMAGDILSAILRRGATLNLAECREVFNQVQDIIHKTSQADLADKHYVNVLIQFLEADKKGGAGFSYRAFVSRFGSEAAKMEFATIRPETREEHRRRCEAENVPDKDELLEAALGGIRIFFKRLVAKVTSQ